MIQPIQYRGLKRLYENDDPRSVIREHTVRANWRVIFRFAEGDVLDLDYVDYH
jgi:plasmid maintenance system killer protein